MTCSNTNSQGQIQDFDCKGRYLGYKKRYIVDALIIISFQFSIHIFTPLYVCLGWLYKQNSGILPDVSHIFRTEFALYVLNNVPVSVIRPVESSM